MSSGTIPLLNWVICSIIGLCTFLTNTILLKKEIDKGIRKAILTTKALKIYSIIYILFGSITGLDLVVLYINGVIYSIFAIGLSYQFILMGFYQLSRLHYCFANEQIYSNNGYPNWLFIIMQSIGVICMIALAPALIANQSITDCGIDGKLCIMKSIMFRFG